MTKSQQRRKGRKSKNDEDQDKYWKPIHVHLGNGNDATNGQQNRKDSLNDNDGDNDIFSANQKTSKHNHYDNPELQRKANKDLPVQPGEDIAFFYGLEVLDSSQYELVSQGNNQKRLVMREPSKTTTKEEEVSSTTKRKEQNKNKVKKEESSKLEKNNKRDSKKRKRPTTKDNDNHDDSDEDDHKVEEDTSRDSIKSSKDTAADDDDDDDNDLISPKSKKTRKKKKKKKKQKSSNDDEEEEVDDGNDNDVNESTNSTDTKSSKTASLPTPTSTETKPTEDDIIKVQMNWNKATGGGAMLHTELCTSLATMKYFQPTPIQCETLSAAILGRRNLVGAAPTGSGKTIAFLLPILQSILLDEDEQQQREEQNHHNSSCTSCLVQAMIVTPTRELALQIHAECDKLLLSCKNSNSKKKSHCVSLVGGIALVKQERLLTQIKPKIIIGTPGRLWAMVSERMFFVVRVCVICASRVCCYLVFNG